LISVNLCFSQIEIYWPLELAKVAKSASILLLRGAGYLKTVEIVDGLNVCNLLHTRVKLLHLRPNLESIKSDYLPNILPKNMAGYKIDYFSRP
jgi:hypothetical protein